MSAVVDRETIGEVDGFDELAGKFEQGYTYKGLEPGEDILEHPDIPPLDHVVLIHDVKFYAVSYDIEQYYEANSSTTSTGRVVVKYDTLAGSGGSFAEADFIQWERSYQKEAQRVPTFMLLPRFYEKANGGGEGKRYDWVEQGLAVPVKYTTLNVTVNWIAGNLQTRNQIFQIMQSIDAQEDHLHIISSFGTKKWVMQPAQIRQADRLRVEITYHWISDPGNGPVAIPSGVSAEDKKYIVVPDSERPPFHAYQIRPQLQLIEATDDLGNLNIQQVPLIYAVDLYPERNDKGQLNPRYDPTGYRSLPGNPFP